MGCTLFRVIDIGGGFLLIIIMRELVWRKVQYAWLVDLEGGPCLCLTGNLAFTSIQWNP